MDSRQPLNRLVLAASSIAEDLGFVALADLSSVLAARQDVETRLIGGQMVSLHVQRWGLGVELNRSTQDADIGLPTAVARETWLTESLKALGYVRTHGNTFERRVEGLPVEVDIGGRQTSGEAPTAAIDILVPAYTSRARRDIHLGSHLTATEVRGLAYALNRPGVAVELALTRLDGSQLSATLTLPDEASTLVLRAFAWQTRLQQTDAIDVWRSLEVAFVAGVAEAHLDDPVGQEAARIIRTGFASKNLGAAGDIGRARNLSRSATRRLRTRLLALVDRVLGPTK